MENIPYIKQGYFLSSRSDLVWKTLKINCSYYQEIIIGRRGCLPVMCLENLNCKKLSLDCMRTKREPFFEKWLTSERLAFTIQYVEAMRRHQLKKDMISCNDKRRNTNINKTIDWLIDWLILIYNSFNYLA